MWRGTCPQATCSHGRNSTSWRISRSREPQTLHPQCVVCILSTFFLHKLCCFLDRFITNVMQMCIHWRYTWLERYFRFLIARSSFTLLSIDTWYFNSVKLHFLPGFHILSIKKLFTNVCIIWMIASDVLHPHYALMSCNINSTDKYKK